MSIRRARYITGWLILLLSLAVWIWGGWPLEDSRRSMPVSPSDLKPPTAQGSSSRSIDRSESNGKWVTFLPGEGLIHPSRFPSLEEGRMELSWPTRLRLGDPGLIYLTIQPDPQAPSSGQNAAEFPQGVAYNLLVESNLDISGVQAVPVGLVVEPMQPGQPVKFYWSVRADQRGVYDGAIWVHLRFIPLGGTSPDNQNAEIRRPLTNQPIEIKTQDLFGLGGPQARMLGGMGLVLGCLLGMEPILIWLWRRIRSESGSPNA